MLRLTTIEQKLLNIENDINLGNACLYLLCQEYKLNYDGKSSKKIDNYDVTISKEMALADKIWLIGRSYAASPQRRNYGKKLKEELFGNGSREKIIFTGQNDGTESFFIRLAEEILKIKPSFGYKDDKYDFSEQDIEKLAKVVKVVIEFDDVLKQALFNIDVKDIKKAAEKNNKDCCKCENLANEGQIDFLSFSSKFMHFHYPNSIFIIDSISKSHFIVKSKNFLFRFYDGINNEHSKISYKEKEVKDLIDKISKTINFTTKKVKQKIIQEYIVHCAREYILAKHINDYIKDTQQPCALNCKNSIFEDRYLPRVIDSYIMQANKN